MAKEPTVDEAIERARRAQEGRIEAVRELATARQELADVRDQAAARLREVQRENEQQIAAAEREDVRRYNRALSAGWSADELKKIGYPEPEKRKRTRRRRATSTSAPSAQPDAASGGDHSTAGTPAPAAQ